MATERVGRAVLTLTTDGGSFFAGIEQAKTKARGLGATIKAINADIARMGSQYSGKSIIAEATKLTAVIGGLGGASKLTAAEQRRVNGTIAEAIEKYRALGRTAPKALLDLEAATRRVEVPAKGLTQRMVTLSAAIGSFAGNLASQAAYSAGRALFSMAKEAFDAGGRIIDMSNKTALATDTLQEMEFVAKQTGTSIEAMTNASFKLGVNIATGSKTVRDAVKDLEQYGLQWETLRHQTADQQWSSVMAALSKVQDVTERNRLGMLLYGRSFREIAASVTAGYDDIASHAEKSSRAQLEALDAAGDRWDQFLSNTAVRIRGFLGTALLIADAVRAAHKEMPSAGGVELLNEARRRAQLGITSKATKDTELDARAPRVAAGVRAGAGAEVDTYTKQLAALREEVSHLTAAQRREIDAAKALGEKSEDIADTLNRQKPKVMVSAEAIDFYASQTKSATKASKEWTLGFPSMSAALTEMRGRVLGLSASQREEIAAGKALGLSVEQIATTMKVAVPVVEMYTTALKDTEQFAQKLADTNRDVAASLEAHFLEKASQNLAAYMEQIQAIQGASVAAARTREEMDIRVAAAGIEQAKRRGASWQQIYAMERALSRAKTDAAIADLKREFDARTLLLRSRVQSGQGTVLDQKELDAETEAYRIAVQQMELDFELSEEAKREELERTYDVWRQTYTKMAGVADATLTAVTDGFADLLVGARSFKDAMLDVWRAVQRGISNILSDILHDYLKRFIVGLVRGAAGAKGGIVSDVAGIAGGVGGAGGGGGFLGTAGNLAMRTIGSKALGLLGIGGAGSAAGFAGVGGIATTVAPGVIAGSAPSIGAGFAAGSGAAAGGGTAAAAGGGGFMSSAGALLTNPWTAVVAGGIIGGIALYRHFSAGSRANNNRDKFLAQFAGFDTHRDENNPPGFYGLDTLLSKYKKHDLFVALVKAKKPDDVKKAERPIADFLGTLGRTVKVFHSGGVIGSVAGGLARASGTGAGLGGILGGLLRLGRSGGQQEVLIKALEGEAVLTPAATSAIGGPAGVAALNGLGAAGGAAVRGATGALGGLFGLGGGGGRGLLSFVQRLTAGKATAPAAVEAPAAGEAARGLGAPAAASLAGATGALGGLFGFGGGASKGLLALVQRLTAAKPAAPAALEAPAEGDGSGALTVAGALGAPVAASVRPSGALGGLFGLSGGAGTAAAGGLGAGLARAAGRVGGALGGLFGLSGRRSAPAPAVAEATPGDGDSGALVGAMGGSSLEGLAAGLARATGRIRGGLSGMFGLSGRAPAPALQFAAAGGGLAGMSGMFGFGGRAAAVPAVQFARPTGISAPVMRSELEAPLDRPMAPAGGPPVNIINNNHLHANFSAWDAADMDRRFERDILPRFNRAVILNSHQVAATIKRSTRD